MIKMIIMKRFAIRYDQAHKKLQKKSIYIMKLMKDPIHGPF